MKKTLTAPPLRSVVIRDHFWSRYISLVQDKMIPYQWEILNDRVEGAAPSHCMENFRIAAGESAGEYYGAVFQDTDLAKWLEAAAYSLALRPDPELEQRADEAIALIGRAQQPDGYIDTYYTIKEPGMRWTNLREGHELYTAGHLIEAAVAYFEVTGKRAFLDIMCRCADCICRTFGTSAGQIPGYPGHPEIELALVRLYRATGEWRYLETAGYFVDMRGTQPHYFDVEGRDARFHHIFPEFEHLGYNNAQAHIPVREQKTADGHAVRAVYLYSAMADVGCAFGDESLLDACRTLFADIAEKQMFITGGIGSAADGECFTCDYDLPNNYNYSETCASVGLALFALRMMRIERDGKYADVFERALYNTVLGGMALTGTEFFYVNPLEVVPEHLRTNRTLHHVLPARRRWFGVACCPPNIARTLTSLAQYIYACDDDEAYINLFVSNEATLCLGGKDVAVRMCTRYPYEDTVDIHVHNPHGGEIGIAVREPGWGAICEATLDGVPVSGRRERGYLHLRGVFARESVVHLRFAMEPMLVCAHPRVRSNAGKVAIVRGPLVYCLESADNGENLSAIAVAPDARLSAELDPALLGGTAVVTADAVRISEDGWQGRLYRPAVLETQPCTIRALPYCLWNNRGSGEMLVWLRRA